MRQTRADILAYIQQNGPCFKTDVAKAVGITQSGVSRHVEHLIADGLVRNAPFSLKVEAVPVAPPAMAVIVEGLKAVNDQNRGAAGRNVEDLSQALTLALALLGQIEPNDARAMSDEFVSMVAAQCGIQSQEGRDIIAARLKLPFPPIQAEVTFIDSATVTTTRNPDRLAVFATHINWELSHGYPDGEDQDGCWLVHSVNGGRNDREWTLIGRGDTPAAAIDAAIKGDAAT